MATHTTPEPSQPDKSSDDGSTKNKKKRPILDKSCGTAAGLSRLLPTGTTLAFQTMAPSFTRGGECVDHDVNFAFTLGLVVFLTLLTAALNFTDSVQGKDGNTHYGLVTPNGMWLFNDDREHARGPNKVVDETELKRRRLRWKKDVLHAVVSAAVFLALAFCDAGVLRCLVPKESRPWKDFFNHLPLAVGFLATFVFIVYPTTRKGIGEDGAAADKDAAAVANADADASTDERKTTRTTTSLLAAASTLSKLLPTGTTLAFQTMAPSFARGGECAGHRVNFVFTWGLIGVLAALCAALSFTDSVTDMDGHTYYGVATCNGLWLFNRDPRELRLTSKNSGDDEDESEHAAAWDRLRQAKKLRARDFMHAVVSAAVFVTLAFCDAGVQDCLVPKESGQWREFLALLPLAVAFLASFLFVVFPSDRKGIGEEGDDYWVHGDILTTTAAESKGKEEERLHQQQISGCCVCVGA